jgi:hypothetical protein
VREAECHLHVAADVVETQRLPLVEHLSHACTHSRTHMRHP